MLRETRPELDRDSPHRLTYDLYTRSRLEGFGFLICDREIWDKAPLDLRRAATQWIINTRMTPEWARTETADFVQCVKHDVLGTFILLPGFTTQIGSPEYEVGRYEDEGPMYEIYVEPFLMAMHNTTEGVWDAVEALSESRQKYLECDTSSKRPKTLISWVDAQVWLKKASKIAGLPMDLPWEEEWEGACRAGTRTPYFWGETADNADEYCWHAGNSEGHVHEVGLLKPNNWGLLDIIGNVWEWC